MAPAPVPIRRALPLLGGLLLAALALRPQIISIGPLLPTIRADLAISHGVAGLLGTVPVMCMGLFAPLGPWLARRLGPRAAVAACVAGIAALGLLRAFAPGALAMLALTFGIGIGLGAIGPVLSMIVHLRSPDRPALGTGSYASGIVLGATVAAATAVPIAGADGDWRFALAVFSVAAAVSLAAWLVLVPPESTGQRVHVRPLRLPWASLTAWVLALVFGLQSLLFYAAAAWLPNIYVERGWSQAAGANLLALTIGTGLISTLGIPLLADRIGSRRVQLVGAAVLCLVAIIGITVAGDLGVAWAVLLGVGSGALFPLALTLPVDISDDATEVGATAALMLMAGYVISALGPVVLGVGRDLTGNFAASLWILVGVTVVLVAACAMLSPTRLGRGVQHGRP